MNPFGMRIVRRPEPAGLTAATFVYLAPVAVLWDRVDPFALKSRRNIEFRARRAGRSRLRVITTAWIGAGLLSAVTFAQLLNEFQQRRANRLDRIRVMRVGRSWPGRGQLSRECESPAGGTGEQVRRS